jgi:UDP-glucose 4-epimerase
MDRVAVTGGAGFIGSHCVDLLIKKGYNVTIIDDLSFGKIENINSKADFIKLDISNVNDLKNVLKDILPSTIFHFAANATTKSTSMGWNNPYLDFQINMVGTLNILQVIREAKLDSHFIYASSAAVYGEPVEIPMSESHINMPQSPYGISKLAGEKYCHAYAKEFSVKTSIIRIFNTYGPRQPRYVMYDQIKNILHCKNNTFQVLGTGKQIRDYSYVSDTVNAFYATMINPNKSVGKIFNVAGGNKISIKELIMIIKNALNKSNCIDIYTGKSWKGDITKLWANTSKIKDVLGWSPQVSLSEGVEELVDWVLKNEKI